MQVFGVSLVDVVTNFYEKRQQEFHSLVCFYLGFKNINKRYEHEEKMHVKWW